jgi:hypothetical protein
MGAVHPGVTGTQLNVAGVPATPHPPAPPPPPAFPALPRPPPAAPPFADLWFGCPPLPVPPPAPLRTAALVRLMLFRDGQLLILNGGAQR